MNIIAPLLGETATVLKLLAEFEPEVTLLIEALTVHKVDRSVYNAAMRDMILRASAAKMHEEFPNE